MPVVARFYVAEIKRTAYAPGAVHVTLQAVSRGPENKEWAEATPSGSLQMMIKNSPAAQFFGDRLGVTGGVGAILLLGAVFLLTLRKKGVP